MTLELYCSGHIHPRCSWCKNCKNDKHNAQCPFFDSINLITYDVHSPETGERGNVETPVPLQPRAELGSSLDTYSFKTACPDYIVSGNMQLEEEYFGGEKK